MEKLNEIPSWANWVAQSPDGVWWAYKSKPFIIEEEGWNGDWCIADWKLSDMNAVKILSGAPNPDWQQTRMTISDFKLMFSF